MAQRACTPTTTPNPTLPPPVVPTIGAPATFTPIPTITPFPTNTPFPWTPTPTSTPSPWLPFPVSGFQLSNPFGTREFYSGCSFGDTDGYCGLGSLGGGQGDNNHQGIDLITAEDKEDASTPGDSNYRMLYMPVTAVVAWKDSNSIGLRKIQHNGQIVPGLEVGLTHVNTQPINPDENVTLNVGTPLNTYYGAYGTPFPHLHLSVRFYEDTANYSGDLTFYNPLDLLSTKPKGNFNNG